MKVELHIPGALGLPRIWVRYEQALGMALQPVRSKLFAPPLAYGDTQDSEHGVHRLE